MIPIHELLSRIRWDPEFGRGQWEIAYVDHAHPGLVRVPLTSIATQAGDHFMFQALDAEGLLQDIPYHRIREVRRDGTLVWSRPARGDPGSPSPRQ